MGRAVISARTLRGAFAACAMLLAACDPAMLAPPPPAPVTVAAPPPETPASAAMRAHFSAVQGTLLSRGLLRTDSAAADAPFSDWQLAETFIRIALFDEFQPGAGGGYVQVERESRLRRREGPVRVAVRFGASVPPAQQQDRRAAIGAYLARLSAITGHPIRFDQANPNFFVYVLSEDERQALGPEIAAVMPGFSGTEIAAFTGMPQSTYCQVSVLSESATGIYLRAFAVIRAEHPDLLFRACVNEEIAQGLGLPNDSPRARPSIFNDDQEFALLTSMDALMLRILYNPALRPGMTAAEARPIVQMLARALTGGGA